MLHRPRPARRAALLVVAVLAALALVSGPSRPAGAHSPTDGGDTDALFAVLAGSLELAGLVPVIGTAAALGRGEEPSTGWIVSNFVLGTTHTAIGLAMIGSEDTWDEPPVLAFGLLTLATGLTNYGLGIAGLVYEPPSGVGTISLAPVALPTADGGIAPGLALSVFGF